MGRGRHNPRGSRTANANRWPVPYKREDSPNLAQPPRQVGGIRPLGTTSARLIVLPVAFAQFPTSGDPHQAGIRVATGGESGSDGAVVDDAPIPTVPEIPHLAPPTEV